MSWNRAIEALNQTVVSAFKEEAQAVYLPKAGGAYPLSGIFDRDYQAVDLRGVVPVATRRVVFSFALSHLPVGPKQTDRITVNTVNYQVESVQEDGQGMVDLVLKKI